MQSSGRDRAHPDRGTRKQLRLNLPPSDVAPAGSFEIIPLPLDPRSPGELHPAIARLVLLDEGFLVAPDRVAGPREMVQHLEATLQTALDVDSIRFLPFDHPPGAFWASAEEEHLPLWPDSLRDLAHRRSHLIYVRDFAVLSSGSPGAPGGSGLYLGLGDEEEGWTAVIEARDRRCDFFTAQRIGLAVLLAKHFEILLAASVRLQSRIFQDPLTGLYNRAYLEDQMERLIGMARRHDQSLALCILDIDNFKMFNTLYGYEGGDQVLITVGNLLKGALRTTDTVARYGGEEFVILLAPPVGPEEARTIAERLRATIEDHPFHVQSLEGKYALERITISAGGAFFPDSGRNSRDIWTAANRMLLIAKEQGKNQVRFA